MTRAILRVLAASAIVFAFGLAPAAAQTGQVFGELVGKVIDDQGGVLPGVTVTLSGPAVMGAQTATTNERGLYRFPGVNTGTYTLKFELAGFSPLVREGIVVPVRQTVTVDASMRLASLQETVTVSGASPTVDVENTKVGARLDHEILTAVPTSRTIFGSTTVLPGMTMGRQDPGGLNAATSTGMVAHGAGNYNLNYYGVTADTPANYGSMYYMDFGSAEEISVDTAAMGAEVGGGGGANINIIPKSGGNNLKGDAFYSVTGKGYWSGFTGSNITDDLKAQGVTDPSLQGLQDFNANAGGPFVKDRLWWFGSLRNYRTIDAQPGYTVVNSDGSLTNPFLSNLRNYTLSGKYQINKNNQLSVFWTYNKKFQPHRNGGVAQPNPINTLNQQSPKNLFNGNWTSVMGQNTFLEVSSTYFHMHWPSDFSEEFYALPANLQHSTTFNNTTKIYIDGPEPTGQRFRDSYRGQTNVGLTRYVDGWLGASHQLKSGFENWYGWGQDYFNVFNDTRLRYSSNADGTNLQPLEVYGFATPLTQKANMRNFAAFVQDRVSYSRFTFNLGLRWSFYDGLIPEQSGGGGRWFPVTNYPEIKPPYSWNTLAPRTGVVIKLTEDGKNVVKASYSRYYEVMYTTEYSNINPNVIGTGNIPLVYAWRGDLNGNGLVEANELGVLKSQFVPSANSIDPNLRDPKTDEIMFAFQREVANNVSFNVDWIQRWFNDQTINQDCYGLPCDTVATKAYAPTRVVSDPGPDNIRGTGDDRSLTFYDVTSAYLGKDTFVHTNCGSNVSVSCTQRYRALEISLGKRMSNHWQMQGSYVWSRLDGDIWLDYTNPNNLIDFVGKGATATGGTNTSPDQPHAFKLLGSYQAPWGITVGANYQALSGLPRDRNLTVNFAQGSSAIRVEPRGTYRGATLNLLSLRADKSFRINGSRRASFVAELHNALNSSADQFNIGTATQNFASQAAFDAARRTTSYFGRVQEIVAPRVLKIGFRFDF
ncbi:MAG: TonB-dependent receptor [Acidobacteria bacterium]|nr:TonB-dependent receptor [Acidobacteriota bacterium]